MKTTVQQVDQMAVEFHWLEEEKFRWAGDEKYLLVVRRLKQFFEVGHIHFNNASCIGDLAPFPTWAYEVLFVSKRLAVVDHSRRAGGLHPLDAPNNPSLVDYNRGLVSALNATVRALVCTSSRTDSSVCR
jgi:hypothetical protein